MFFGLKGNVKFSGYFKMLEPLLMLTFLNCFFMFSTTVTTCALWLQHKRNHCCVIPTDKKSSSMKKERIKKKFKDEILKSKMSLQKFGAKLAEKKRDLSRSREKKLKMKPESETKSFGVMAQPVLRDTQQQLDPSCCAKLTSTEDFTRKNRRSESRGSNRKSTLVMEVSTIQKVVQVVDKDRIPSKQSLTGDCVSYRVPPDAERRIEFIVQNKSDENSTCNA